MAEVCSGCIMAVTELRGKLHPDRCPLPTSKSRSIDDAYPHRPRPNRLIGCGQTFLSTDFMPQETRAKSREPIHNPELRSVGSTAAANDSFELQAGDATAASLSDGQLHSVGVTHILPPHKTRDDGRIGPSKANSALDYMFVHLVEHSANSQPWETVNTARRGVQAIKFKA